MAQSTHRRVRRPKKRIGWMSASPRRPVGIGWRCFLSAAADGKRHGGGNRVKIQPRLQIRRAVGAIPAAARQGLLQSRRPQRHDRSVSRVARTDQARGIRRIRHGLCRHQFADQVPRRQSRHADQGGVHALQPAAIRGDRPQEPRHRCPERPRGKDTRRAGRRRRLSRNGRFSCKPTASTRPR